MLSSQTARCETHSSNNQYYKYTKNIIVARVELNNL
nr:MAG TPA: hypothetical protein [Caudoviricetes sp.]